MLVGSMGSKMLGVAHHSFPQQFLYLGPSLGSVGRFLDIPLTVHWIDGHCQVSDIPHLFQHHLLCLHGAPHLVLAL